MPQFLADYVLIGDARQLRPLAEAFHERGKRAVVMDLTALDRFPEGKTGALEVIKTVRHAVANFGVENMLLMDRKIIQAIMEVKKSGRPVILIPAAITTMESMIESILKIGEGEV
jgi:hypothetical protein